MLKARGPLPRRDVSLGEWFKEQRAVENKLNELENLKRELDRDYDEGRDYKEKAVRFHELYEQMNREMLELSYKTNYRFELRMEVSE
ncbi:MAG: hypothetical protein ABS862_01550 [Carnobacterium inhibens]|uniref:hypothetical protein n=1 Tax=Carnobacterium sp. TaxID=48221 RepID=UPI0033149D22